MSRTGTIALVLIGTGLFFFTMYSCIGNQDKGTGTGHAQHRGGFLFFLAPRLFGGGGSAAGPSSHGPTTSGGVTRGGFGGSGSAAS